MKDPSFDDTRSANHANDERYDDCDDDYEYYDDYDESAAASCGYGDVSLNQVKSGKGGGGSGGKSDSAKKKHRNGNTIYSSRHVRERMRTAPKK